MMKPKNWKIDFTCEIKQNGVLSGTPINLGGTSHHEYNEVPVAHCEGMDDTELAPWGPWAMEL